MLGVALVTTVGFFWLFVLQVQFRGHTNNISWTVIGPPKKALRPALTALAKAPAMRTGSRARETAVFRSLPSKPHSHDFLSPASLMFRSSLKERCAKITTGC
jgi:hypothetical protein